MTLYNFNTPKRVGRRERRCSGRPSRWNPPEIRDEPAAPVRTGFTEYFYAWRAAGAAFGFVGLGVLFSAAKYRLSLAGVIVESLPLIPLVLIALVTPLVWWRRQRRIEAVMRGELQVEEPQLSVADDAEFRRGLARVGLDRARRVGALGVVRPMAFFRSNATNLGVWGVAMALLAGALPVLMADGVGAASLATAGAFVVPAVIVGLVVGLILPIHWFIRHHRFDGVSAEVEDEAVW